MMGQKQQQQQQPQQHEHNCRFSTILVARSNTARPSELEIHLRGHCQKMRVHSHLSGAHMIFPQEQGLALRIYYDNNIPVVDTTTMPTIDANDINDDDVDGILDFSRHFQWSMVVFVVPDHSTVLNDTKSFLQRAMRLMDHDNSKTNNTTPASVAHHYDPTTALSPHSQSMKQQQQQTSKQLFMMVVKDTHQALSCIVAWADGMTPSRCTLRANFGAKTRLSRFCADSATTTFTTAKTCAPSQTPPPPILLNEDQQQQQQDEAAARHVATAVREWGQRTSLPLGEADVLLRAVQHNLATLVQLVSATTNGGGRGAEHHNGRTQLDTIPIEDRTKRKLRRFFSDKDDFDPEVSDDNEVEMVVENSNQRPEIYSVPMDAPGYSTTAARMMTILSPPPLGNSPPPALWRNSDDDEKMAGEYHYAIPANAITCATTATSGTTSLLHDGRDTGSRSSRSPHRLLHHHNQGPVVVTGRRHPPSPYPQDEHGHQEPYYNYHQHHFPTRPFHDDLTPSRAQTSSGVYTTTLHHHSLSQQQPHPTRYYPAHVDDRPYLQMPHHHDTATTPWGQSSHQYAPPHPPVSSYVSPTIDTQLTQRQFYQQHLQQQQQQQQTLSIAGHPLHDEHCPRTLNNYSQQQQHRYHHPPHKQQQPVARYSQGRYAAVDAKHSAVRKFM